MSPNCTKIANIIGDNQVFDPIMGHGTALYTCHVTEPGWGFPLAGIYAIVSWAGAKRPSGFSDDDCAISPIFVAND